jgi:hypothetical protein
LTAAANASSQPSRGRQPGAGESLAADGILTTVPFYPGRAASRAEPRAGRRPAPQSSRKLEVTPYENWHRPGHHQLCPGLHRRA